MKGHGGVMVTMVRQKGAEYEIDFGTIPLSEVANHERPMPDQFISKDGFDVTKAFLNYVKPLIGDLPEYVALAGKRAKP
jgi:6-phosphofructokinase 1